MVDRSDRGATAHDVDEQWKHWRDRWAIPEGTIYLNHGSFGPTPRDVQECRVAWQHRLASRSAIDRRDPRIQDSTKC